MKTNTKVQLLEAITPWADKFWSGTSEPINLQEMGSMYTALALVEKHDLDNVNKVLKEDFVVEGMPFSVAMIFKRAQHLKLPLTIGGLQFLLGLVRSPGQAVMYLTAIKHFHVSEQIKGEEESPVNMLYILGLMGNKRHSPEFLDEMWDAQKAHRHGLQGDNLLDQFGPDDFMLSAEEVAIIGQEENNV